MDKLAQLLASALAEEVSVRRNLSAVALLLNMGTRVPSAAKLAWAEEALPAIPPQNEIRTKFFDSLQPGQSLDAITTELHKGLKLKGWKPAKLRERTEEKLVVEFFTGETKTISSPDKVDPAGKQTADWGWRRNINVSDLVDACDELGGWYLSTVADVKFSSESGNLLSEVKVGYRFYTPAGSKKDQQGNAYEGWKEMYDEWIPVNSIRIQRPLSVCKEGSMFSSTIFDRPEDQDENARDVLVDGNANGRLKYSLARQCSDIPRLALLALDAFFTSGGIDSIMKSLDASKFPTGEVSSLSKSLAKLSPFVHKRSVQVVLKSLYLKIHSLVAAYLGSEEIPTEGEVLRVMNEVLPPMGRIAKRVYTPKEAADSMLPLQLAAITCCFKGDDAALHTAGEELIEIVCASRELPFHRDLPESQWVARAVCSSPAFWAKFADNLAAGFSSAVLTMEFILRSDMGSEARNKVQKSCRDNAIQAAENIGRIRPKFFTPQNLQMISSFLDYYKGDSGVAKALADILWNLMDPHTGFQTDLVNQASRLLLSISEQWYPLIFQCNYDIEQVSCDIVLPLG